MNHPLITPELATYLQESGQEHLLEELVKKTSDYKASSDYLATLRRIRDEGVWIENARTGQRCKTLINVDLTYHVDEGKFPLDTTRKSFWKAAIAELLGFIRGETNAATFRELGTKTWDANANLNESWLNNPNRKGEDDMGLVYGAVGNNWPILNKASILVADPLLEIGKLDLLAKIVDNLSKDIDDRGEIWTFWNPGVFQLGCLRPCMFMHHFSLDGEGYLHLNSYQRSYDALLGGNFNAVQCYTLLALIAQITGHKPGKVYHKVINAHIYEDQWDIMLDSGHLEREEFDFPTLKINPNIQSLDDLRTWVTVDDFEVEGYHHHDAIKYPMQE